MLYLLSYGAVIPERPERRFFGSLNPEYQEVARALYPPRFPQAARRNRARFPARPRDYSSTRTTEGPETGGRFRLNK